MTGYSAVMWLATKFGFFSIVQKQVPGKDQLCAYQIRARIREDLQNLLTATGLKQQILEWPAADYRYRIIIAKEDLTHFLDLLAESLDYSNFKSKIAETPNQSGKLHAYHQIWHTMAGLQVSEVPR